MLRCLLRLVQNDSIVRLLEPLHGLLASHLVRIANAAALSLTLAHTATRTSQLHVEIHTEDTGVGIVLDTQIDVLLNTKTEVSGVGEVSLHQLVLLHLQSALQNLQSLLTTDRSMHRDLLITTNGEGTNGKASYKINNSENTPTLSINRLLSRNLLQNTSSLRNSISRFSNANVNNELLHSDISHNIRLFALEELEPIFQQRTILMKIQLRLELNSLTRKDRCHYGISFVCSIRPRCMKTNNKAYRRLCLINKNPNGSIPQLPKLVLPKSPSKDRNKATRNKIE